MDTASAPVHAPEMARVVNQQDVVEMLRQRVAEAGSQRAFAMAAGVNASDLGAALKGTKAPTRSLRAAVGVEDAMVQRGGRP